MGLGFDELSSFKRAPVLLKQRKADFSAGTNILNKPRERNTLKGEIHPAPVEFRAPVEGSIGERKPKSRGACRVIVGFASL